MDPELLVLFGQDKMSRISPDMMARIQQRMSRFSPAERAHVQQQVMSNPDLLRTALATINNIRPEDMKLAAEELENISPEYITEVAEEMANASPEKAALLLDGHYEINVAQMLKKEGNELHSQGKFKDASEKYLLAKKNLRRLPVSTGRPILSACSLNLMSCYLKTNQYDECIKEGTEVLNYDSNNVKALYRRGQAYKEVGQLENAIADLGKAHEVSPDDETICKVFRYAKENFIRRGGKLTSMDDRRDEGPSASVTSGSQSPSIGGSRVKFTPMSNMTPETVAIMISKKFGLQLLREEEEKAQQAMSSLSPQDMEKLMKMVEIFQGGKQNMKKAKNRFLGRRGMALAVVMLVLAILLHWLGYIGR